MVKNFGNQIVMVEMRRPLSVNGETRYDVYQSSPCCLAMKYRSRSHAGGGLPRLP